MVYIAVYSLLCIVSCSLDLLFCYKIVFSLLNVNVCDFFELNPTTSTTCSKYIASGKFFVDRIINIRNALLSIANFSTIAAFRNSVAKVDFFLVFFVCGILPV